MIKKIIDNRLKQREEERRNALYRKLIRHEASIGAKVFGQIPTGHRREFFCLDEHTWVWHEEWIDHEGNNQTMNTRYEVRSNGIFKVQNGLYRSVSNNEAKRLIDAAQLYQKRVNAEMYAGIA